MQNKLIAYNFAVIAELIPDTNNNYLLIIASPTLVTYILII